MDPQTRSTRRTLLSRITRRAALTPPTGVSRNAEGGSAAASDRTDDALWVLAGNYQQFVAWCLDNEMSPRNWAAVRYISDPDFLAGRAFGRSQVIRTGTWYQRTDLDRIELRLEMAIRAVR